MAPLIDTLMLKNTHKSFPFYYSPQITICIFGGRITLYAYQKAHRKLEFSPSPKLVAHGKPGELEVVSISMFNFSNFS